MSQHAFPSFARISDYCAYWAERAPDAEAAVLGDLRLSYAKLSEEIDSLAKALMAAGVRKGDRVATLSSPHPDYLIAFLATASIGAIWLGLNPKYRLEELSYAVNDAEPCVLLARREIEGRDYAAELDSILWQNECIRVLVTLPGSNLKGATAYASFLQAGETISDDDLANARASCGGRDPCLIVYTSGSTGKPKGALLHHEGLVAAALEQNRNWPITPLRVVNYFPINHVGCLADVSTPTIVAGGTLIFMEHFDPRRCLELMQNEGVTLWATVPSVFHLQLALPDFAAFDLSALQLIVWEGAAIPDETLDRLLDMGLPMATNYGMTESTCAITVETPTRDREILAGSVGLPAEGVEIRLVDSDGRVISEAGAAGELQTRSKYNMLGYWRRPEASADTIDAEGWMRTGDTALRREDGRYRIVGRLKEMFKSGGYNVYPREVENAIEAHPLVDQVAVVSVEDAIWQEVGVAFVTLRGDLTAEALQAHCRDRLANYKIPKSFIVLDTMPLLPIGKIDKTALALRARAEATSPKEGT
jgi:acyl-CoA synthetase (AMP-forming)/AMP-acid ligase II